MAEVAVRLAVAEVAVRLAVAGVALRFDLVCRGQRHQQHQNKEDAHGGG